MQSLICKTTKVDYACKALLEMSLHWPNYVPLQINVIANRQNIPMKFLTQILISLKQFGFVESIRGKKGGYLLAMSPKDIKLSDVIRHFDNTGFTNNKNSNGDHVMDAVWHEVDGSVLQIIDQINFENICNRKRQQDNVMMFQI